MSRVVRSVKNVTKGYSSVQVKVREATSNDAWGPTGTQMQEIAQMTYNGSTDFYEIMDMLDKRLNDKGKNWRHVLKSLKVLDYILHEGSELVITWSKKNIYIIKTLREFVYVDDEGRDVGQNVRVAAKELTSLINDDDRLRSERNDRKSWKSRVTGIEDYGPGFGGSDPDLSRRQRDRPQQAPQQQQRRRRSNDDDDLEYKLALEASKNQAEEDARRRGTTAGNEDDPDLAKAIKLSKEEEELRRKELEDANAQSLFDDGPAQPSQQPQFTGYNQGYQQQGAVDWFGNPIDQSQQQQQQQPQATGYLNNMYSQPTGFQNQFTGMPQQQQQQNGFDQFGNQNQQQQPQQNFMQPQQTAFNPFQQQQQQQQPQQQQQSDYSQFSQQASSPSAAGSNNPFGQRPQNNQSADALKPAPTGSNNPFGSSFGRPQQQQQQPQPSRQQQPTLNSIAEQRTAANPITGFTSPTQQHSNNNQQQGNQSFAAQQRTELDPYRARLNNMLQSGEGMDTFGNTGESRVPAQHTAPGAFVNSAGQNLDRLRTEKTGNNPFMHNQFTGMPQQQPQQQQQQGGFGGGFNAPAQTGPVGGFGGGFGAGSTAPHGGGNNPFGQRPQGQQQPGGGSLIDL